MLVKKGEKYTSSFSSDKEEKEGYEGCNMPDIYQCAKCGGRRKGTDMIRLWKRKHECGEGRELRGGRHKNLSCHFVGKGGRKRFFSTRLSVDEKRWRTRERGRQIHLV